MLKACFTRHCTALLQRCSAAHYLAAIALHCTASRAASTATRPYSALLHRLSDRPVSAVSTRLAERRYLLERLPPSSDVFYQSGSLRESAFFNGLCHAQLISRSSSESQAVILFSSNASLAASLLRLGSATAPYQRSTLPATAILPCTYNHLPSGTAVIFNFNLALNLALLIS